MSTYSHATRRVVRVRRRPIRDLIFRLLPVVLPFNVISAVIWVYMLITLEQAGTTWWWEWRFLFAIVYLVVFVLVLRSFPDMHRRHLDVGFFSRVVMLFFIWLPAVLSPIVWIALVFQTLLQLQFTG